MPTKERKKEERSGTTVKGMKEGERAQWSKEAASKKSSNVYGGVDYTQRSGDICGV